MVGSSKAHTERGGSGVDPEFVSLWLHLQPRFQKLLAAHMSPGEMFAFLFFFPPFASRVCHIYLMKMFIWCLKKGEGCLRTLSESMGWGDLVLGN